MYISRIKIFNYRNLSDLNITFNESINIIIGHNNVGKSNLIRALSLIFDSNTRKQLNINDFNKHISLEKLKENPPKISIQVTIAQGSEEELMSDDLVVISNWITKLEEPYEAQLTYEFFLPVKEHDRYSKMVSDASKKEEVWQIIEEEFLRLYSYKIWGGNQSNQAIADRDSLRKFDFQFLDAIRDVERDMFTGRNTLLKDVIDFFMDYDIKSNKSKEEEQKIQEIKERKQKFTKDANKLLINLTGRMEMGKKEILSYARDVGASFDNSSPDFDGKVTDVEFYSALQLIVQHSKDLKIPVSHNGLGYNNLIFMSLLLSKMQVDSDGEYLGSNAKVFPILAIEEPEAHLHPTMQYHFLNFLDQNRKQNKVRQVFITTHSTHIVASTSLDYIICLYKDDNNISVAYPGKALSNKKSKKYVQRFLDATKSDMLFAEKVVLVEGIAEQVLMSVFARYVGLSLEERHVTVINVGGKYFDHFLSLFDCNKPYTIKRKVAFLTDIDPERKNKKSKNSRYKKCYPYDYGMDKNNYEYKKNRCLDYHFKNNHSNIRAFTQNRSFGMTFEYELALANPTSRLLLTDSIRNKTELGSLMDLYEEGVSFKKLIEEISDGDKKERLLKSLEKSGWEECAKKKAIIATRYLDSVEKGENALELAINLLENIEKDSESLQQFNVPKYIKDAIEWVCEE